MKAMRSDRSIFGMQIALICFLVVLLEALPRMFPLRQYAVWLPLSGMISGLIGTVQSGVLLDGLLNTLAAVLAAFCITLIVGVPVGIWIGANKTAKAILDPYMVASYAVPFFAFYPVIVTIVGFGLLPIVLTSTMGGVIGVLINTALGISRATSLYTKVARSFRLSQRDAYLKVYIPAAMPNIFIGTRLGLVYSFLGVIVTEFILSDRGLGYLVQASYQNFNVARMLGAMLFVLLLGAALTLSVDYAEGVFYRWRQGR